MATAVPTTDKNKKIAAAVLGVIALITLYYAFGRSMIGGSSAKTTVTVSTTPRPTPLPASGDRIAVQVPTADEQSFVYETTPVSYIPGQAYAPDPGRNIFAFYEPPPPTPYVPPPDRPDPPVVIVPPSPTPTPAFVLAFVNPQSVFVGSQGFRLEVNGDRFTPESRIYFNQMPMPTTFVNPQRLVTDIPMNLIAQEGPRQIIVQTPDGRAYSNQMMIAVQAPPKPNVTYIGMIARKRYNNDTAYFTETGKPAPYGARLNDVILGRFRLVDISAAEVVFEDTSLGFRHRVPLAKPVPGTVISGPLPPGAAPVQGFTPFDPAMMNPRGGRPPGIPANVQPYVPPDQKPNPEKKDVLQDVDDTDDGKPQR
jgi:hypothetical protein